MKTDRNPEEIQEDIRNTRARMDETLEALEHRLSPGELLDKSLAYIKAPGGYASELTSNLGEKIKENPLPLALVGIGLGWLMMANGRDPHARDSRSAFAGDYDDYLPESGRAGAGYQGPIVSPSGDPYDDSSLSGLKESAEQLGARARSVKEGASATAEAVKERATAATGAAAEKLGAAGARMDQSWREARASTRAAAARTRYEMERIGQRGRQKVQRAQRQFEDLMQDQPLVLGALGVMVGVAAGASLPPTRREDELVGEYRDQLLDEAVVQSERYKQKAQQVADAALKEGSREARAQGMSARSGKEVASKATEALTEQVRKAEEKIEHVGTAAYEGAKREAERQDLKSPDNKSHSDSSSGP